MRVIDINHARSRDEFAAMKLEDDNEVHHMRLTGHGVNVTLIEREDGIDVQIDPTGEPYMHRIRNREVTVHDTQVRVSGLRGAAL